MESSSILYNNFLFQRAFCILKLCCTPFSDSWVVQPVLWGWHSIVVLWYFFILYSMLMLVTSDILLSIYCHCQTMLLKFIWNRLFLIIIMWCWFLNRYVRYHYDGFGCDIIIQQRPNHTIIITSLILPPLSCTDYGDIVRWPTTVSFHYVDALETQKTKKTKNKNFDQRSV